MHAHNVNKILSVIGRGRARVVLSPVRCVK